MIHMMVFFYSRSTDEVSSRCVKILFVPLKQELIFVLWILIQSSTKKQPLSSIKTLISSHPNKYLANMKSHPAFTYCSRTEYNHN